MLEALRGQIDDKNKKLTEINDQNAAGQASAAMELARLRAELEQSNKFRDECHLNALEWHGCAVRFGADPNGLTSQEDPRIHM